MLQHQTITRVAPSLAQQVIQLNPRGSIPLHAVIFNHSETSDVNATWQSSSDGTTWSDIVGKHANIGPRQSWGTQLANTHLYLALQANGDDKLITIHLIRAINTDGHPSPYHM